MINEDAFSQLVVNEIPVNVRGLFRIAKTCHEVNRAYCESLGDHTQLPWEQAPVWQRQSCVNGVLHHLTNPNTSPEESHAVWLKEKLDAGWKYGPLKNETLREHPCCVPYAELSATDKAKDFIFRAIVRELRDHALQERAQADTRKRWACSYCGEVLLVPVAADEDEAFKAWARNHVETVCPKHPLRDRDARIAELGAKLLELTQRLENVRSTEERNKEWANDLAPLELMPLPDLQTCTKCGRSLLNGSENRSTRVSGKTYTAVLPDKLCWCGESYIAHSVLARYELAVARQLIDDNSPEATIHKRKALGLTVEKLAEALAVAPNIIQGWENGTLPVDPGSSTRLGVLICDALDKPVATKCALAE